MAKKGYVYEKRIMDMLRRQGKIVERVSGSIGASDLTVVSKETKKVEYYLQVKSSKKNIFYFSSYPGAVYEWKKLYERYKNTGIPCYFWFSFRQGGKRIIDKKIPVDKPNPPQKIEISD